MSLAYFNRALDRGGELTNVLRLSSTTASGTVVITLMGDMTDMDCVKSETLATGDYIFLNLRYVESFTYASGTGTLVIEKFQMPEFRQPYVNIDAAEAKNIITFAPNVGTAGLHER